MDTKYDPNGENPIYGISSVDNKTLVPIKIDPVTGYLKMEVVGSYNQDIPSNLDVLKQDTNTAPAIGGVSVQDFTIIPIRCDESGNLKVQFI